MRNFYCRNCFKELEYEIRESEDRIEIFPCPDCIADAEKQSREATLEDMKNTIEMERSEAYDEGHEEGYDVGYFNGEASGYDEGYSNGKASGYDEGYSDGKGDCEDE